MTKTILCPECEGDGYVDGCIGRTYGGDYITRRFICETCNGAGEIEVDDELEEEAE